MDRNLIRFLWYWQFRSPSNCGVAFTVHRSPFTVHRSPFAVRRSPFTVHRSPFAVHRLPFTVHRSPFTVRRRRSLFTVHRSPFACRRSVFPFPLSPFPGRGSPVGRKALEVQASRLTSSRAGRPNGSLTTLAVYGSALGGLLLEKIEQPGARKQVSNASRFTSSFR